MYFSKRYKLAQEVDKWLEKNGASHSTMGVLSALTAMGYQICVGEHSADVNNRRRLQQNITENIADIYRAMMRWVTFR